MKKKTIERCVLQRATPAFFSFEKVHPFSKGGSKVDKFQGTPVLQLRKGKPFKSIHNQKLHG